MNILDTIMAQRCEDVEKLKQVVSLETLMEQAASRNHHSLSQALRDSNGVNIIAEMKKASPSAGLLVDDYRPAEIAKGYYDAGAVGISVLTEPHHFQGSKDHLLEVRDVVELPVLRKDFICDEYEVYEAAAWGADVVLLIVAALSSRQLASLYEAALKLSLDVLVEAHTSEEVNVALGFEQAIVGVNSRSLKTLETDLAVGKRLAELIPSDRLSIAESGIKTAEDVESMMQLGYNAMLVGEVLMKSGESAAELETLGCQKRK